MAELAVLTVASKILQTIASPAFKIAYEKACSIKAARKDLDELGNFLTTIRAVLHDAEKKTQDKEKGDLIKIWIKELKGVLYDADDLFEEVATDDLLKQQRKKLPLKAKVWASCSNSDISRSSIADKVKAIKARLSDSSKYIVEYRFVTSGQNEMPMRTVRDSGWVIDATDVIGRDEDKRIILKMLFDESDDPLVVIGIFGIGGMGKTAMAKLVSDDKDIQKMFQKRWYSCISDTADETDFLGKIFQSVSGEIYSPALDVGQLLAKIRKNMECQKYLLVLDDVWEDKPSTWLNIKSLLSCGAKGSRIIVTTRLPSVEKIINKLPSVRTHTLKGLSDDDSWSLFKRLAFGEGEMDPEKEKLGREILKKCHGVPLAIQSIGNLLGHEDSLDKWRAILEKGLPEMGESFDDIMRVLKLSYDHLPSNPKHCFAYCSLFPKDVELIKKDLINHWTAQGYVEPYDAESTFMYLLRMGMFQEAKKNYYGEIRSCKMHDLMHDLALYVAGEESVVLSSSSISPNNPSNCARHVVSVVNSGNEKSLEHLKSMSNAKSVRSLILSNSCPKMVEKLDVFARFKYLRTLSLAYVSIKNIPDSVGELKLLRYLDLKATGITKLPNSIANLVHLLSLDLQRCWGFREWPLDFHKLAKLRYLNTKGCNLLKCMPVGIGGMSNLQHLSDFRTGNELNASDGLPPQLRGKLSIWVGRESGVDIQSWQLPASLQHLEMKYQGVECDITKWLTNGIRSTNKLARLQLEGSENVKYLPSLRFFPKLRWLRLNGLSGLEFMEEEEGNNTATSKFFPCLEELQLIGLLELKGWWRKAAEVTSSSSPGFLEFPLLRKLTIKNCPQLDLKSLPPSPGVQLLNVNGYYVKMARGRASTSSNPPSFGGLEERRTFIKSIVEYCISDVSDVLLLLPIQSNFDEYMSIKLVFAHRLDFEWMNGCKTQRIDLVEEAQMPASSLTVLIINDYERSQRSELPTIHYVDTNHIFSITVRRISGQLSSRWEEFFQHLRSNVKKLQFVSGPQFTDDSRTLLRTDFELFSQPPPPMPLDQFNPGASSSTTTISRQPPSSTNKEYED